MNAQTQITALNAEYAASTGLGLTFDTLQLRADKVRDCSLGDDDCVTVFFTEDRELIDAGEDGYDYGPGDLTFIGVFFYDAASDIEICLSRENAITRWGQSVIYECEEYCDGRNQ